MSVVENESQQCVPFRRGRFVTQLPADRLYTASHFWLASQGGGRWRIGFTQFATRMLGELVEHEFEVTPGAAIGVGQVVGWVEGFKAVSDLYSAASGAFAGGNPALNADVGLAANDPYGQGWLYEVDGEPDPMAMDVAAYAKLLSTTIDTIRGGSQPDDADEGT